MLNFIKRHSRYIAGFFLILFSVVVFLSIVSYKTGDYQGGFSITDFSTKVNNYGGRFGAWMSYYIFQSLGISALVFPFLLLFWGIVRLAKKNVMNALKATGVILVFYVILSTLVSLVGKEISQNVTGDFGRLLAYNSQVVFGSVGAYFVVIVFFLAFIGFVTGFDFKEPFIFIKDLFIGLIDRIKNFRKGVRERKKAERENLIEEYKRKQLQRIKPVEGLKTTGDLVPGPSTMKMKNPVKEKPVEELEEPMESAKGVNVTYIPPPIIRPQPKKRKGFDRFKSDEPEKEKIVIEEHVAQQPIDTRDKSIEAEEAEFRTPEFEEHTETQSKPIEIPDARLNGSSESPKVSKDVIQKPGIQESAKPVQKEEPKREYRFRLPPKNILNEKIVTNIEVDDDKLQEIGELLINKLKSYGVEGGISAINPGPVITRYEFEPAPGVKVNQIVNLSDDLALALKAQDIRIVAPVPGKGVVGIEIPNQHREIVYIREILESRQFCDNPSELAIALGKTVSGVPFVVSLAQMPHLLIAGATGSGKSVCINSIITSLMYKSSPEFVQFVLIDPKRLELSIYNDIPYLRSQVVNEPDDSVLALKWTVEEMERRYVLLAAAGVRKIEEYNKKIKELPDEDFEFLPYLVVVIDELADLMSVVSGEIETPIARIAQKSRAVGIHLIIATQRPSVDVITGLIKANFPCRIAFKTRQKVDSRTILDTSGAEKLLGKGDMLYLPAGRSEPVRIHGVYISTKETERLVEYLKNFENPYLEDQISFDELEAKQLNLDERDELFMDAAKIVILSQKGSSSLLQRKLRIGYTRAASLIDQLEDAGIVGGYLGSKARQVLVDDLNYLDKLKEEVF
ncbi:DNA translocase FtsK [bacterium]|nr:DNA translocase FtsK [bacterium]